MKGDIGLTKIIIVVSVRKHSYFSSCQFNCGVVVQLEHKIVTKVLSIEVHNIRLRITNIYKDTNLNFSLLIRFEQYSHSEVEQDNILKQVNSIEQLKQL